MTKHYDYHNNTVEAIAEHFLASSRAAVSYILKSSKKNEALHNKLHSAFILSKKTKLQAKIDSL